MFCENCGSPLSDYAKFCNNCGTKTPDSKYVCPKCGAKYSKEHTYCEQCGINLLTTKKISKPVSRIRNVRIFKLYDEALPFTITVNRLKRVKIRCNDRSDTYSLLPGGYVDLVMYHDRLTIKPNFLWGARKIFNIIFSSSVYPVSEIKSFTLAENRLMLVMESGGRLVLSKKGSGIKTFYSKATLLIEPDVSTGG